MIVVTIDGPAGSGKSTAARLLAARLGFQFLDTGAMYRAVALECVEKGVDLTDDARVAEIARKLDVHALGPIVRANGRDVTAAIRSPEVSVAASRVAVNPAVREAMVRLQRQAAALHDVVTEGRDQGTVVFPQALCKFYLTADPNERIRRRQRELEEQGESVGIDDLRAESSSAIRATNREKRPRSKPRRMRSKSIRPT